MKGIYWRPKHVSSNVLILIALLAVAGALAVEMLKVKKKQDYYREKMAAARAMDSGLRHIKEFRARKGVPIDKENDPTESGVVGVPISSVTSNTGYLEAKQATINPNFAAVAVHLLKQAGLQPGDVVALGLSGSFPALNIAVLSAVDALGLEPLVISTAAASEWGANIPGLTWLEMENHLNQIKFMRHRSLAASLGGHGDKGLGMSKEGKDLLRGVIASAKLPLLWPKTLEEGIEQRMALYEQAAGDRPIKVYVNVGGGTVSVGAGDGKRLFKPGLNRRLPTNPENVQSVMVRFASLDVPVIHFTKVKQLCEQFNLPYPPKSAPAVGQGNIFYKLEYNRWLVVGVLTALLLCLFLLVRLNLAHRFAGHSKKATSEMPEPMV